MIKFDEYLWRGPRPKTVKELADDGFKVIITLQSGTYDTFFDDEYELDFPWRYGIREYCIPMDNFSSPHIDKVREAVALLRESQAAGVKTYIHCLHGKDRTGYVVAAYRMLVHGWLYKYAKGEMLHHGFHLFPYACWLPKLKKFEGMKL